MNKLIVKYLIVTGIMAALVISEPDITVYGLLFFVVPGILLGLSPILFFYPAALVLFASVMTFLGRMRWVVSLLIVASISVFFTYKNNINTYSAMKKYLADDVDISEPIKLKNSIAFISPQPALWNLSDVITCDDLCQKLLYNGAVKNVLIGHVDAFNPDSVKDIKLTSFYTEHRTTCPEAQVQKEYTAKQVLARIAAGDCILTKEGDLAEADFVFFNAPLTQSKNFFFWTTIDNLDEAAVSADRRQIFEKLASGYKTIYQKTHVIVQPLVTPLLYVVGGGYQLDMDIGFARKNIVFNDFEKIGSSEQNKIFGSALKELPDTKLDEKQIIRTALLDKSTGRTAGHDLFGSYLKSFVFDRDVTPEDTDIVILALQDDRIDDYFDLPSFVSKSQPVSPTLTKAIADRIFHTPKTKIDTIESLARGIRFLPDGGAKSIFPQLKEIAEDKDLRGYAWGAVLRLGDKGDEALPIYIAMLEDWKKERDSTENNYDKRRAYITGALVGLCRMGHSARAAKDNLFEMLDWGLSKGVVGSWSNQKVLDALLHMGMEDEIIKKFGNKESWKEIETIINQHEECGARDT